MHEALKLKVPKWPFFSGDAVMVAMAGYIYWQSKFPLGHWELASCGICLALGAFLGVMPFFLEYRALLKLIETSALGTAMEKIKGLEAVAAQISGATNHWQRAQEQADKTAANAREISERMAGEVRDFTAFMQKINEGEKSTLRLEVEKLRRAENDWLNVLVNLLDHIYALYHAAERSGQASLIGQLGSFQNACRDSARRIGLVALAATIPEPFDATRHQWADGDSPPVGATVTETLATGYTFQGKPIRPILVRVQDNGAEQNTAVGEGQVEAAHSKSTAQNQLPLESAEAVSD